MSRIILGESIPLKAPLSIRIDVNNNCNFNCEFCYLHHDPNIIKALGGARRMSIDTCKSIIDSVCDSFGSVKTLIFATDGEPFLNPDLLKMIKYAHEREVCEKSFVITNGSLLTHDIIDDLIESGLNFLQVSINGLSDEDYRKHCGVNVSFDKIVDSVRYFYEHKRNNVTLYVKILNYMVPTDEDKARFFEIFQHISDISSIEPLWADSSFGADFAGFAENETKEFEANIEKVSPKKICHFPFYTMSVTMDGDVTPCCFKDRIVLGNIHSVSLGEIWDNDFFEFQRAMLDGIDNAAEACKACSAFTSQMKKEDVIDPYVEDCKKRYDKGREDNE